MDYEYSLVLHKHALKREENNSRLLRIGINKDHLVTYDIRVVTQNAINGNLKLI